MLLTTSQLVENTLALYDSMDDEAANSYVLSFILLRVGCASRTYDFEQFIDMSREEKDKIVKDVRRCLTAVGHSTGFFVCRTGRAGKC